MPRRKKDENGKEVLTPREQLFVEGVAQGKSLTQAAKDAGYSEDTAHVIGSENLQKPIIQLAINERIQGLKAETDEIHRLLALQMRADMADFDGCFNEETGRLDWQEARRRGVSRLVKKFKTKRTPVRDKDGDLVDYEITTDFELYSAQEAAKVLADIHGLKQAPKANEADVERVRAEVKRLVEKGWTEADARSIVIEAEPQAAQWLH